MVKQYSEAVKPVQQKIHRQVFVVVIASIPAVIYGVTIGWVSSTLPLLQSPLSPSSEPFTDLQISLAASIVSLSAAVSTSAFSYFTDRFGRKPTILMLSALYAIAWTLKLVLIQPTTLIIARAIAGLSAGGLFVVVPIYIREVTQDSIRGALGVLLMTACNLGVIAAYGFGILMSYHQSIFIYVAISVLHFIVFFFMPETPVYCVKRQKFEEAAKNIAWLRSIDINDNYVEEEIQRLRKDDEENKDLPKASFVSIVKNRPVFRAVCTIVTIAVIQPMSGNFAIINYASSIFQRANTAWPPEYLGLFVGAVQLTGTIVSANTIEKLGRKPLLVSSLTCVGVCTGTVGTWFLLVNLDISVPGWIPVVAICLCIFGYGLGLGCLPVVIMAEMFDFQHRARVAGFAIVISWSASFMNLLTFIPLANAFGESTCFFIFSAVAIFGTVFVIICLPETKGKSLEEIQQFYDKKAKVKCIHVEH